MSIATRALVIASLCTVTSVARAAGVQWFEGALPAAIARAQAENKLVFVDVYATWCAPCHQLDADIFPRDEVGRTMSAGYVAMRVDGEANDGIEIANRYHVAGFPTLLVLDAHGAEIERLIGASSPAELIHALIHFREGHGGLAELEQELAHAPTDALRFEVAMRHAIRADPRAVAEIAEVLKADPQNHERRAATALMTLALDYYQRGEKDYAHAEAAFVELEKRFPTTAEAERAPYYRALGMLKSGQAAQAKALLDAWIGHAPRDVQRLASYAWFCFKESGDRARGIVVAKRGLELEPKNDALWDTLGELYLASGDGAEAKKAFLRAAELSPKKEYYQHQLRKLGGTP